MQAPPAAVAMPSQAARPVVAASEFSTAPMKKRHGILVTIALFILFLAILATLVICALAYFNPTLLASYIPQVEMFFPAPVEQEPVSQEETFPVEDSSPLLTATTTDTTTSASTSSPASTSDATTAP
jgi:hypothetical protein